MCIPRGLPGLVCRMWSSALIHAEASVDFDYSLGYIQAPARTHARMTCIPMRTHGGLRGRDYFLLSVLFCMLGVAIHDLRFLTEL